MRIEWCIILLLSLVISCGKTRNDKIKLVCIDLFSSEQKEMKLEDIADSVSFVRLETNDSCLIKDGLSLYVTDTYILKVNPFVGAYLFDRKTGEFLREIGRCGQGPDEYLAIPFNSFDENDNVLYADKGLSFWIGYDLHTGKKVCEVKRPSLDMFHTLTYKDGIPRFFRIDSAYYIAYVNNMLGQEPLRLVVFDKNGNVIKIYPNDRSLEKKIRGPYLFTGTYYFRNEELYFFEDNFDTIYKIKENLIPYVAFNRGGDVVSYEERLMFYKYPDILFVDCVFETNKFILFNYEFKRKAGVGYFDKNSEKTYLKNLNLSKGTPYFQGFRYKGLNLYPRYLNLKQELCGFIYTQDLLSEEILELNPEFQGVKEDDNPVIFIIHLKK
ncbi:6-bladed beta-propeller [uncultured Parabacteroides sp.]|uniref:6-bladed beta-propeller n=1 Tax=uncultured Parabacteroides sp. TaxID=512312 RepID=UPI00262AF5AA|nr:6-bladed beta-propeller [uncultured Parabacteroides sp.]